METSAENNQSENKNSSFQWKGEKPHIFWIIFPSILLLCALFLPVHEKLTQLHLKWVYPLIYAWSIGSILTPLAIQLSFWLGWLDIPAGRKAHVRPTPILGGFAIIGAFGIALLLTFDFSLQMKGVGIGGLLIWLVGVVDDKYELRASLKLFVQLIAVGILLYAEVHVSFLPDVWWGTIGEYLITAFWVLGITNAVNFLDGMDGLATGMSALIAIFVAIVAVQTNQIYFSYVAIALFASCLAFLPYNFRKTRSAAIFLGDNGATFLGFTLAATVVMGDWAESNTASLVVPLLLMGVPIFDMTLTTVMRFYHGQVKTFGEWLAYAGRDHFHHRLAALGIGRYLAVLMIWGITFTLGISAVVLKQARGFDALLLLLQELLIFLMISFFMIYVRSNQIKIFIETQNSGSETKALNADDLERALTTTDKPVDSEVD